MSVNAEFDPDAEDRENCAITDEFVEVDYVNENHVVVRRFSRALTLGSLLLLAIFIAVAAAAVTLPAVGYIREGQAAVVVSALIIIVRRFLPRRYRPGRLRSQVELRIPVSRRTRQRSEDTSENAG
jgi:uncharacterized membrane protein YjjP (DUF1212 family)